MKSIFSIAFFACSSLLLQMSQQANAEEFAFKKTTAFWLRGSSISVHPSEEIILRFSILNKDGTPHTSLSGSITTNIGAQAKLVHIENGEYEAILPPVDLQKPTAVQISLNSNELSKTWKDTWFPRASGSISIKTPLSTIIISDELQSIPVDITVSGPLAEQAHLEFSTSSGTLENIKKTGKGIYRGDFIPNKKNKAPRNILISVSDQNNPQELFGATVIPMYSKIKLPLDAPPNTDMTLVIQGKETTKTKSNETGRVIFDVLIPPGVSRAKLKIEGSTPREDEIDLNIPKQKNVIFIPPAKNIPTDKEIKIHFFVVDNEGKPNNNSKLDLNVNLGSISPPKLLKDGIYEATYTPSPTSTRTKVTIRASDEDTTTTSLYVDALRPQKLVLKPKVSILDAEDTTVDIQAQLYGNRLTPLSNRKLHIESPSASMKTLEVQPFGNYTTILSTELAPNIPIIAHVHDEPSSNPPVGFVIDAKHVRFSPKSASFTCTIVSHDSFGSPVANVPYALKILEGDAQISESTSTNEYGFSYVTITPGEKEGPVLIQITSEGIFSEHLLFQFKETTAPSIINQKISGSVHDQEILKQWRESIAFLSIPREEIVDEKNNKKTTKAHTINVTHTPSKGRPGGEARLRIDVLDKNGNGILNAKLRAFSSLGSISAIEDLGGGTYETIINIPSSIQNDIEIEVDIRGSSIQKQLVFPVAKGEARQEQLPVPKVIRKSPVKKNTNAEIATKQEPQKKSKPPPKSKKKPAPKESQRISQPKEPFQWPSFSWPKVDSSSESMEAFVSMQGSGLFGQYSYKQDPFVSDSKLYSERIVFDKNTTGSAPADSVGGTFRIRANTSRFAPSLSPFVAFEARVTSYTYAVALEEFPEPIRDWNTQFDFHIIPRYSFSFAGQRAHIGARLGFGFDDIILFTQTFHQEKLDLSYLPQLLQGPSVGGEIVYTSSIGLTFDAFVHVGIMGGIYRKEFGTQLSYPLGAIDLVTGFRLTSRDVTIEGNNIDLGLITDEVSFGYVGLGYNIP